MGKELYPEGIYLAKITNHGMTKAGTGTPQWFADIRVTGVAADDNNLERGFNPVSEVSKTIYEPLTAGTVEFFLEKLRSIGFTGKSPKELYTDHPDAQDFIGREIVVSCEHDEYKEKMREKWKISRRKARKSLSEEDLDNLEALFGDKFKETADTSDAGEYFDKKAEENGQAPKKGRKKAAAGV